MASKDETNLQRRQLTIWFTYECLLPLTLIILLWPIVTIWSGDIDQPFLRIFSTAELTVFSALLFLGMFTYIEGCIDQSLFSRNEFFPAKTFSLFVAFILLFVYAIMKDAVLSTPPSGPNDSASELALLANAYTSISAAVVAATFCFSVRWKIMKVLES